ncbi:MAG: antitoxin family protein [Phycisphaerales bacterium]|nr:MAG: antitoxin family protein [Phycisphaerales bacterium]
MMRTINAVYEGGVLRPLQSLDGIAEHARVKLTTVESVESSGSYLADCIGTLPDEAAAEMGRIIESEFEQVNLNEW